MQILKFISALLLTFLLLYFLDKPLNIKEKSIPPIARFFNPFSGFWQNAEPAGFKMPSKSIRNTFLKGKVEVAFDERLVPHIFGENIADVLFVQGYITAQNRLWQMDISTRASGGRLAEILGESLLERDKLQRRKGLLLAAEKTTESWKKNEDAFKLIKAYVAGVNAYTQTLKPKDFPVEYKLLGYAPEPWSPLKTALFYKSMEETLNSKETDLEYSNALRHFGPEAFAILYPEWNPKQSPIIPEGTSWNFDTVALVRGEQKNTPAQDSATGYYELPFGEKNPEFLGSNNWAVAAQKTRNGNPILCNDPHLRLSLPSIWYEVQLSTPDFNAYGVSFPGVPGIMIGFNEYVAFGSTNGGHDVLDWYKIKWADEAKKSYMLDGKATPVSERIETIFVKGKKEPVLDTVKYTVWGPVVSEEADAPYSGLAMHWIAHETGDDFIWKTFWDFNKAKNYDDFLAGTHAFGHPIQNFVFASIKKDIGLKVSGQLPLKRKEQGRLVEDGSNSDNAWYGYVPSEQMPQSYNPERGFVSSANQHSTAPDYPYYYNGWFNDYRGRYINRRLAEMDDITVEDMMALQNDNYSILAEEALPVLIKNLDTTRLNATQTGILKILKDWDYRFDAGKVAPAVFEEWLNNFSDLTWDEISDLKDSIKMITPDEWRTIDLAENDPLNVFFDIKKTSERESPADIATLAFVQALDSLKAGLADPTFNWARYKSTNIAHLARIEAFSKMGLNIGGYYEAINAVQKSSGPSWRMVVELTESGPKAWGVYPGGQSGNPASPFFDNFISHWSEGRYYELFFMKNSADTSHPVTTKWTFSN